MESLNDKRERLETELASLKAEYRSNPDGGVLQRMTNVKTGLERTKREIVEQMAANPENREAGSHREPTRESGPRSEAREAGLRALDELRNEISAEAGDRLDGMVRKDRSGVDSRYLAAVSDPAYESAFAKRMTDPDGAPHSYTPEEAAATRKVAQVASERALAVTSSAGYAVPATLDPTINLTSDGSINPIRELASVKTISSDEWQGVNSEGVVAHWYDEAEEASDDAPTLTQPTIRPERMSVWVPFSIEAGQDWTGLTEEMSKLFADAKDNLEATAFTSGSGSGEPQGLHVGGTVVSSTSGTATVGNYYTVQAALAPRWQGNATWLSSNATQNHAYRLVASADTDEPPLVSPDRKAILGKPWREVSTFPATTAGTIVSYGDIASAYTVVDRIGSTIELVPHLMGSNRRPTGQRGFFFYARVGGRVTNPKAVRSLVVT